MDSDECREGGVEKETTWFLICWIDELTCLIRIDRGCLAFVLALWWYLVVTVCAMKMGRCIVRMELWSYVHAVMKFRLTIKYNNLNLGIKG